MTLQSANLREVTFSRPLRALHHSCGILLRSTKGDSSDGSPRAVAEVRNASSPDLRTLDSADLILAAEDGDQHATWLRVLSQHTSSTELIASATLTGSEGSSVSPAALSTPSISNLPAPLLRWLTSGDATRAALLLDRIKDSRTRLMATQRDVAFNPLSPSYTLQPSLSELQASVLGLCRQLREDSSINLTGLLSVSSADDTHNRHAMACPEQLEGVDVMEGHTWLRNMAVFVSQCCSACEQASLGLGSSSFVTSSWSTCAANTVAVLRSVENVLRDELLQQRRIHNVNSRTNGYTGASRRLSSRLTVHSAMSYEKWWSRKVAV